MNRKILRIGIIVMPRWLVLILLLPAAVYGKYELTNDDIKIRAEVVKSISEPGAVEQAFSHGLAVLSSWTPDFAKRSIVDLGSYIIKKTLRNSIVRNELRYLNFGADNAVFSQYDSVLNSLGAIPEQPVCVDVLRKLLETAQPEREHTHNGTMSGGVYDGSKDHMDALAQFFRAALLKDKENRDLFPGEIGLELATQAFAYFQSANPLHGNLFPLAVKSMREIGNMVASLVDKQYAIASSSGEEALRIAISALKNRLRVKKDEQVFIYAVGDSKNFFIKNIAETLNIRVQNQKHNAHFAVLYLTKENLFVLDSLKEYFSNNPSMDLHIHFDNNAFRRLLLGNDPRLRKIFELYPLLSSVSFDSDGIFYQGISATVFADANRRFDAFEAHIAWPGGIYPGISTAGSLPGFDYIAAYLAIMLNGKEGLESLAKNAPPIVNSSPLISQSYQSAKEKIIDMFEKSPADLDEEFLKNMRKDFLPCDLQKLMEKLLIDTMLHIFDASSKNFSGLITSGGTESIRIAIQTYFNRFKKQNPKKTPIFLMTEQAHIAFDRHIKDLDSQVIRIQERNNAMDLDDLEQKIKSMGAENIAAIVASTPNYPIGTSDPIVTVARIALRYGIPFHVDSCLGAFLMQFLANNSVAIRLNDDQFDGITSWSADLHKYGITQKGLSFLGLRNREDLIMPNAICKKRSATQLEVALLCLLKIGRKGYVARAQNIIDIASELKQRLIKINGLEIILPASDDIPHFVIAFGLKDPHKHLTYTVDRFMRKLGWQLSSVGRYRLHIAITNAHTYNKNFIEKFESDMTFVVDLINKFPNMKQSSSVGFYGMAAAPRGLALVTDNLKDEVLTGMLKIYAENLVE